MEFLEAPAFTRYVSGYLTGRVVRAAAWTYRKIRKGAQQRVSGDSETAPSSPSRRQFLQQTAVLVSATPFVAAGYGLFYERQNVEVVRHRVRLARLPKTFDGFRIALPRSPAPLGSTPIIRAVLATGQNLEHS
jgi:hypothetical protein